MTEISVQILPPTYSRGELTIFRLCCLGFAVSLVSYFLDLFACVIPYLIPKSASLFLIQLFTRRPDGFIHRDFSRTPLKVYWLGTDSHIEFPSRRIWFDGGIQRSRRRFVRNASAWGCEDSPTKKTPRDRSTTWIPSLKGMVALGQVQRGVQSYQLVYLG